ncbi:ComEC family protein [Thalassotalea insulae]|uniref:ComEC family protein n=1 Tax=Thalassotalea insulae TaxID=2056778 RepID=A0ABQ6H009_9GAMM|nr:DNA internalization-related competence protein ComEC/Rec2 [Thalassotalea insulae]GLX79806.1 ComEC family protein [Thalassotalea insulae]
MDWWLMSFFTGALLSLFLPIVPSLFYFVVTIALALLIYFFKATRLLTGVLLGSAWMLWSAASYQSVLEQQQQRLNSSSSTRVIVEGEVDNIPQYNNGVQRFNFIITQLNNETLAQPMKIRLAWQQRFTGTKVNAKPEQQATSVKLQPRAQKKLKQGQQWRLTVRIKPPHGMANSGGFSYQTWLRRHGIHATGYVLDRQINQLLADTPSLRQRSYDQLTPLLAKHSLSGVVYALTFGERSQLTKQQWQVLTHTATQHLIAISGLHLGLVAAFGYFVFSGLVRVFPLTKLLAKRQALYFTQLNNTYLVLVLTLMLTAFYAYLAGFTLPTVRALLMLVLLSLAKCVGLKLTLTRWLALTLFVISWCYPMSLISASFWLSFYAVSIIFLLIWRFECYFKSVIYTEQNCWQKLRTWITRLLALQLGLIVFMLPLTLFANNQLSLAALPANLLAVPWMSVTSIPMSLMAVLALPVSTELSSILLDLAVTSIEVIWHWLSWLSRLPYASIDVSNLVYLAAALLVLGTMLYLTTAWSKVYFIGAQAMVVLLLMALSLPINDEKQWQVNVMDVGQGLAVVVEASEQALVYDSGASFPSGFSMAEAVLSPYLTSQGYQVLDLVIISHDDNDHSGGLTHLQGEFTINQLIYNQYPQAESCIQGTKFRWQFLTIEMLSPKQNRVANNDDSCVIKISDGHFSVLLTGDISLQAERQLIVDYSYSGVLNSDMLIVPHHGSKSSSSADFIRTVAPKFAVFSAGFLNRWQMPTDEVVKRYQQQGVTTFNTAEHGMVKVVINEQEFKVLPYRQQLWPFWFAN